MTNTASWLRFQKYFTAFPELKLAIDISRVDFPDDFLASMTEPMATAFAAMDRLENGEIANPDEKRQVGHYWLRAPELAPKDTTIAKEISQTIEAIKRFAAEVHAGTAQGERGNFRHLLVIGIGGSALGPQFVGNALGHPDRDKLDVAFFDNTDPDGMDKVLARLKSDLGQTLCIVISKSGGTKETENGMKEAAAAYRQAGLSFERHAVAVTMPDSSLEKLALGKQGTGGAWLRVFHIWEWVGGRTSETSAVGLLPAALQGFPIQEMLDGACACDRITRDCRVSQNPAAQLALMWFYLGRGRGEKDMVVIPYKDRLELFSRYLQQLVMESLGKELDLDRRVVNQGLAVYGNKGSTDQHAYIQQLRDGLHNFFVVFVEVLKDRSAPGVEVEPGITSGDYLAGFLLGTRQALYEKGRQSITLVVEEVSPFTVGVLIALFERAVGLYAQLTRINAYHQPGVQAGKVAADAVLKLQRRVVAYLAGHTAAQQGRLATPTQIAEDLGPDADPELVYKICEHLASNPQRGVRRLGGNTPDKAHYAGGA